MPHARSIRPLRSAKFLFDFWILSSGLRAAHIMDFAVRPLRARCTFGNMLDGACARSRLRAVHSASQKRFQTPYSERLGGAPACTPSLRGTARTLPPARGALFQVPGALGCSVSKALGALPPARGALLKVRGRSRLHAVHFSKSPFTERLGGAPACTPSLHGTARTLSPARGALFRCPVLLDVLFRKLWGRSRLHAVHF